MAPDSSTYNAPTSNTMLRQVMKTRSPRLKRVTRVVTSAPIRYADLDKMNICLVKETQLKKKQIMAKGLHRESRLSKRAWPRSITLCYGHRMKGPIEGGLRRCCS